jgi:5-carboxymethyl-2-hydroxymuconate isomerase
VSKRRRREKKGRGDREKKRSLGGKLLKVLANFIAAIQEEKRSLCKSLKLLTNSFLDKFKAKCYINVSVIIKQFHFD